MNRVLAGYVRLYTVFAVCKTRQVPDNEDSIALIGNFNLSGVVPARWVRNSLADHATKDQLDVDTVSGRQVFLRRASPNFQTWLHAPLFP